MSKKLVYGVGVYEKGKYVSKVNKKKTKEYAVWNHMLERIYSPKYHEKEPTYIGCEVCPAWIHFQDFADWMNENIYFLPNNENVAIDKDILNKGNKVYSPENCIFVPSSVNNLLTKSNGTRGKYPIGVSYKETSNKFESYCRVFGKKEHLGLFDTPEEAFLKYKEYKEKIILTTLETYKGIIPKDIYIKLYKALSKYKVEIDD